ncbi:glutamyl-tRNA reductase [Fontivita pretiosa]|uniref:glutamyl-tRNA reductase n=1 Tax=Fontivita pretiosa TaxID=2989684 RepID=UPI003D177CCD
MQRLLLLGLNHTTAPLDVRERLAFSAAQQRRAIELLRQQYPQAEAVLLSTCNRVELYIAREVHAQPRVQQMIDFLSQFHGVPVDQFRLHLYERAEREAVEHLFGVAASLDSMVLGESQILGQVRQAYDLSRQLGAAGPVLNPLFQRALAVGKQVMNSTPLGEGRVSVSGVAVEYARQIFDHFQDKTVLCVGAGKMSKLALRGFAALKPGRLLVANRDEHKARRLAAQFAAEAVPLTQLDAHLVEADIVISSTGAVEPVITRRHFQGLLRRRRYRPIFIIDLAVPRDVEPAVAELEHVYLYNLDDLQRAVARTHSQRSKVVEQARAIVQQHVEQYLAWQRQRELGPAIDQLYRRCHAIAADEVARALNRIEGLDEPQRAAAQQLMGELARRIVNKILHDPVTTLRQGDQLHAPAGQYLHALQRLFHLEPAELTALESTQRAGENSADDSRGPEAREPEQQHDRGAG